MHHRMVAVLILLGPGGVGCASLGPDYTRCADEQKGPNTLLAWEVGRKRADEDDKKKGGDGKKNGKDATNGDGQNPGNGEEPEEPKELATDRPDFTEGSTTVGLGRVQLEAGYTYSRNKQQGVSSEHSFPETLLRLGLFAEWFELRIGQNYSDARGRSPDLARFHTGGLDDLYLGSKLALTEQKGYLPEMAMIVFTTIPIGHSDLTADRMLPGVSCMYSWVLVKDALELAGGTVGNAAVDATGHGYTEVAQSFSLEYTWNGRTRTFTEVYGIFPHGAVSSDAGPQYYFDSGLTYRFTPNFQVDIRGGVGLNRQSDDYFVGSGFVVRY